MLQCISGTVENNFIVMQVQTEILWLLAKKISAVLRLSCMFLAVFRLA